MKKTILIAAVAIMMLTTAAKAGVQQNVIFSFDLPFTHELKWGADGSTVNLTFDNGNPITVDEIIQGYKEGIDGGGFLTTANSPYSIIVLADSNYFVGGDGSKPVSDLYLSINGSPYTQILGLTPVEVSTGGNEFEAWKPLMYKIEVDNNDAIGTYSTVLTFTMTTP